MRGFSVSVGPRSYIFAPLMSTVRRLSWLRSRPGLMSLALIVFLFSWQEYLLPLVVFQTESLKPLTVGAASLQGRYGVDYGGIAAAGLIALAPLVVLFLAMQRSFVRGLTAGAVK